MVKKAPDSGFVADEPRISPRHGDPISHGLNLLSAKWNGTGWGQPASNIWLTAYTLSRLAELAPGAFDHALGQKIQASCEWLLASRTPEGRWNNLATTAHALSALKSFGRDPGLAALESLERSLLMAGGNMSCEWTAPGVAVAVKATGKALPVVCEPLQTALTQGTPNSDLFRLVLCAEILDWPSELLPPALSLQVSAIVDRLVENPPDRITLLRCLLRLGRPRAWELAAELKAEQLSDGSWHAPDLADQMVAAFGLPELCLSHEDKRVLITVSATTTLAIGLSQNGLYFGSDEPAPRRLRVVKVAP